MKRLLPLMLLAACSGGSDDETTTAIPIPTNSTDSCIAEINGDLVLCLDPDCNNTEAIEELAESTARVEPLPEPEPTPSLPEGQTPSKSYSVKIGGEWVININMCSDQVQSEDNDTTTNPLPVVVE